MRKRKNDGNSSNSKQIKTSVKTDSYTKNPKSDSVPLFLTILFVVILLGALYIFRSISSSSDSDLDTSFVTDPSKMQKRSSKSGSSANSYSEQKTEENLDKLNLEKNNKNDMSKHHSSPDGSNGRNADKTTPKMTPRIDPKIEEEIKKFQTTLQKGISPKKIFADGRRLPPIELLPQKPNNSSVK